MTRLLLAAAAAVLIALPVGADDKPAKPAQKPAKAKKAGPLIGHMVYFKLKDGTAANREKLVEACKKYLSEHDGVVFFSAGVIADDFKRDVNDRDWDVGLHLVFADKAAHDKYQDHPKHLKFIEENKDSWAKVRVFDSEFADFKAGKTTAKAAGTREDEVLRRADEALRRADEAQRKAEELQKRLDKLLKELEQTKDSLAQDRWLAEWVRQFARDLEDHRNKTAEKEKK
jgi:hypothetical protein